MLHAVSTGFRKVGCLSCAQANFFIQVARVSGLGLLTCVVADVSGTCISLSEMIGALAEQVTGANVVVLLDACRTQAPCRTLNISTVTAVVPKQRNSDDSHGGATSFPSSEQHWYVGSQLQLLSQCCA